MQEVSYQFGRGSCAVDYVINSSRPSPSVFPPLHLIIYVPLQVVSSYKESRNNKPVYGYMLPNLSLSPNLYKVQSVYNNNVTS